MDYIIIIFIVILIIWYFNSKKNKLVNNKPAIEISAKKNNISIEKEAKVEENIEAEKKIQKPLRKEIKEYQMVGMKYQNLNELNIGFFKGKASSILHSEDPNCIEIKNEDEKILGYLPRGNYRLHNAINEMHNGEINIWGDLGYNDYYDSWFGIVYIPIGLDEKVINDLFKIIDLKNENISLLENKKELSNEFYFKTFDNYYEILKTLKNVPKKNYLDISYPLNVIPSFSKKLESESDWGNLIKLSNYEILINELNEKYRNTTLKRIEKARLNYDDKRNT
ncbi:hypothetical protein [Flavobacterium alkalisoli]|uniref:hypothetical protein n=1 Tax=Flavobacterium alkalisoli TaxID=2602769 RepID=UPI003A8E9856